MYPNVRISLSPDYEIRLHFQYNKALTERIKETFQFAAYRPSQKCRDIPPTPRNLHTLLGFAEAVNARLTFPPPQNLLLWHRFQEARVHASQATLGPPLDIPGWQGSLLPHQQAGVTYMARTRRCLVTDEDDEDRRVQALAAVAHLQAFPAVIVAPADQRQRWLDLIAARLPLARVAVVAQREGQVLEGARVYLVSDAVLHAWLPLLGKQRPKAVIADEADRFIHPQSERTKALRGLVRGVPYRFLLTPRPVHNAPGELFPLLTILGLLDQVVLVLKRRLRGGKRLDAWEYFRQLHGTHDEHVLATLNRALRVWGYLRRTPEDLSLTTGDRDRRFVPVALADFAAYQALEWTWVLEFPAGGKRVHGPHIFQRLAALRREVGRQKWPRARTFLERLRGQGENIVVVAYHQEMVKQVAEHFGWPLLTGRTSKRRRREALQRFPADPTVQGLVLGLRAQVDTPLPAARHMVFLEMDWEWVRMERMEQVASAGEPCTFWYMVAPDTLDIHMLAALARKKHTLDALTAKADEGTSTD